MAAPATPANAKMTTTTESAGLRVRGVLLISMVRVI
jgi:hypothetical protein